MRKKKRSRTGHKASATRMVGQIETIIAGDPDLARLTLLQLTLKQLETIKRLNTEIIDLIEEEAELTEEIERADSYKETTFSALIELDKLLKGTPSAPPTSATATPLVGTAMPTSRPNAARLPKPQLRHYNGELTKWTSFWQSFEAAVDRNPDLSEVEKFNSLPSLLEGVAREAIAGLSLNEANYKEAVKKRLGGTQQIVSNHMEALLQVEAVSSSENVRALRRMFDNISSHIRRLASLDVQEETYGTLLCPVLISKFPADL